MKDPLAKEFAAQGLFKGWESEAINHVQNFAYLFEFKKNKRCLEKGWLTIHQVIKADKHVQSILSWAIGCSRPFGDILFRAFDDNVNLSIVFSLILQGNSTFSERLTKNEEVLLDVFEKLKENPELTEEEMERYLRNTYPQYFEVT